MQPDQTISKRNDKFNQILSAQQDFYNIPLVRAIKLLKKENNYSLEDIKRTVFNGETSRAGIADLIKRYKDKV